MYSEKDKEKFLVALEKNLGIVTSACKSTGISRSIFYDWKKKDEAFAKRVGEIDEVQGDFVEGQLIKAIASGDTSAIIYYCKTKLKKRGYGMQLSIEADVNAKAEVKTDLSALPDELLAQVLEKLNEK